MSIDLDRLFKLRLIVARLGEMDLARWWNTTGQLGRMGALALRRGFPRTHRFAQARAVFAVAAQRCAEVFDPPECITLWKLPAEVEDAFDDRWQHWLDNSAAWQPLFGQVETLQGPPSELLTVLSDLQLLLPAEVEAINKLPRTAEDRAVQVPGVFPPDDAILIRLAAGFARGEMGQLAVPYARLEG